LREVTNARVAIFYDPAQRPVFRGADSFDANAIYTVLRANPVRIQLQRSVRYSRPILDFLKSLRTPATATLVDSLQQRGRLPEGPDVEIESCPREHTSKVVSAIVQRWTAGGLCRPDEILVLSLHGRPEKSALAGCAQLGGFTGVDFLRRQPGSISMTSVNKAKGLDALGVIIVDFHPFNELSQDSYQVSYFMGASRARQLLAIVHNPKPDAVIES